MPKKRLDVNWEREVRTEDFKPALNITYISRGLDPCLTCKTFQLKCGSKLGIPDKNFTDQMDSK
jgi:hypothetical protein